MLLFSFLKKYFLCQGYELSGEIALKNNHYYYYYYYYIEGRNVLIDKCMPVDIKPVDSMPVDSKPL